jgi:hypothetical protein
MVLVYGEGFCNRQNKKVALATFLFFLPNVIIKIRGFFLKKLQRQLQDLLNLLIF